MSRQNVFFTSDTHAYHKNICKGTSSWTDAANEGNGQSCRDFKTPEEMTDEIVWRINDMVKEDDVIYHLGDWSFGGMDKIYKFRKRINCRNIHLIYGNHDQHIEGNRFVLDDNGDKIQWDNNIYLKTRNLFLSCRYVDTVKINGVTFFLSHYAHRVWDKSHHGRIHLYGHSHNSLEYEEWGRSMDVGLDAAFARFGQYRPFSFGEVMEIMNKRESKVIDHHNSKTN